MRRCVIFSCLRMALPARNLARLSSLLANAFALATLCTTLDPCLVAPGETEAMLVDSNSSSLSVCMDERPEGAMFSEFAPRLEAEAGDFRLLAIAALKLKLNETRLPGVCISLCCPGVFKELFAGVHRSSRAAIFGVFAGVLFILIGVFECKTRLAGVEDELLEAAKSCTPALASSLSELVRLLAGVLFLVVRYATLGRLEDDVEEEDVEEEEEWPGLGILLTNLGLMGALMEGPRNSYWGLVASEEEEEEEEEEGAVAGLDDCIACARAFLAAICSSRVISFALPCSWILSQSFVLGLGRLAPDTLSWNASFDSAF
mmetsp:Transcript_30421/g.49189  ORF Transcript_30421/g.49189 Transcript_30421/m.49189 type:complete len:317 (+) Transcript_30421:481-1431(+)